MSKTNIGTIAMNFVKWFVVFFISFHQVHSSIKMVEKIHQKAFSGKASKQDIKFHVKNFAIGNNKVYRSIPLINNIAVEGADAVIVNNKNHFMFSATKANLKNIEYLVSAHELLKKHLRHFDEENIETYYEKIYLNHFGEIHPSYKIRNRSLDIAKLKDIYISGRSGEILKVEPAAFFANVPARTYVYSPSSLIANIDGLKNINLTNLYETKEGDFINGKYFNVKNCCEYYTCEGDGPCDEANKRCALKSHKNSMQKRETILLPSITLGLSPIKEIPEDIYIDTVRCTYLPFAKASKNESSNKLGFFDLPLDGSMPEANMDKFAEVQAYFSIQTFFNHMRALMQNDKFCLRNESMECNEDGEPILNEMGFSKKPFNVFVNHRVPDTLGANTILDQILGKKGTKDNPVKIDRLVRTGNAAFVPAKKTLKESTSKSDEILSGIIDDESDRIVFFQGNKDFSYDGDIVFHEFMHAIITTLVGKLNSLGLDTFGINSEPGALNEGWSDYFSASFAGDSKIGEYAAVENNFGEASLRDINNNNICPRDIVGEVHNDSLVWSGALWEIRSYMSNKFKNEGVLMFDRAVLFALSQSKNSEDFSAQSNKLIASMKSLNYFSAEDIIKAEDILNKRGLINCFKASKIAALDQNGQVQKYDKKSLTIPSKNNIGLKNYAPSNHQISFDIPKGAISATVKFKQYFSHTGAFLGEQSTLESELDHKPLGFITSFDSPIEFSFKEAKTTGVSEGHIIENIHETNLNKDIWEANIDLTDKCQHKTLFLSFVGFDYQFVLENISVDFIIDENNLATNCVKSEPAKNPASCDTKGNNNLFSLLLTVLLLVLKKNRKLCPIK